MVKISFDKKGNINTVRTSLSYVRKNIIASEVTKNTINFFKANGDLLGLKETKDLLTDIQVKQNKPLVMKLGKHEHNPQVHTDYSIIIANGFMLPNSEGKLERHNYECRKVGRMNAYYDRTIIANIISQEKNNNKKQELQKKLEQLDNLPKPTGHY